MLNNTENSSLKGQIEFREDAPAPDGVTLYDWHSGDISGETIENDYSKFIISQMRLDLELVTKETEQLTRTAGWRFSSGDNLAQALDYASYRMKIDQAIKTGLPVEAENAAKVLKEAGVTA